MKSNHPTSTIAKQHVPAQYIGSSVDAVEKVTLDSEKEALDFFELVKERLMDVNHWYEIANLPLSSFQLTDEKGNSIAGMAAQGLYIKIDIPGPGTKAGAGYDWVYIETVNEEKINEVEILSMTVRPAQHPATKSGEVAHFFQDIATSTFQVIREARTITASEHGRNEKVNTQSEHSIDSIRNFLVGFAAKLGFSYPQWKNLVKGMVAMPHADT